MREVKEVVIAGAYRSPTGRLLGRLSGFSAPSLGAVVIRGALKGSGLEPHKVDEVIMGNVISAGLGQNPARQSALLAGLPDGVGAFTVNKVCASGLKAVALGAEAIMLGEAEVVIAGGMESMSNAPFLLREMRGGKRMGNSDVIDSMVHDGLRDCYYDAHMGELCEYTVEKYGISREEQDRFAFESQRKAMEAAKGGLFKNEIIPLELSENITVSEDESIRRDTSMEKLSGLRSAFKKGGTVTAGNSPGLNDGAAVLILTTGEKAQELGLKPLASILGYASAHLDPKWYTLAPVDAVKKLLRKTGLDMEDFDLIEENEAFAAETLAVVKELSIDPSKVNVHGGAIALGHPIGASGARVLVTLLHALRARKKELGLAAICLGGGGAMTMAVRAYKE
ncbi:MAG: acetyl-CoA C-acetyltransferase [Deltaproteobacteria bacterium]|nr:acetyl-CoA C-acetyltransferase [Deltaproteobacteria bacterium]